MIVDDLVKIGLSEKEANLYLMLVRMGPSPASVLSKRVGMKRATVYGVLNQMCQKGFVTFINAPYGRQFSSKDPECLLALAEKDFVAAKHRLGRAKQCIKEIERMDRGFNAKKEELLRHFGGEALWSLEGRCLSAESVHFFYFSYGQMNQRSHFLSHLIRERINRGQSVQLTVGLDQLDSAERAFPQIRVKALQPKLTKDADLLLMDQSLYFIEGEDHGLQMLKFQSSGCIQFLQELLGAQLL